VRLCVNAVRLQALDRAPPQQLTMLVVKSEGGPPVSVKPGQKSCVNQVRLSHCLHDGLVTVQDEARLRKGHNDQSRQGHQCSEANMGIPVSHKYPLGIEPGSLMSGSKGLTHWTSETLCECSETAGSAQDNRSKERHR
jgi:hypothetical protein